MTLTSANSSPVDATSSPKAGTASNAERNGNVFVFEGQAGGVGGLSPDGAESRSFSPPDSLSISTRGASSATGASSSSSSSSSTGVTPSPATAQPINHFGPIVTYGGGLTSDVSSHGTHFSNRNHHLQHHHPQQHAAGFNSSPTNLSLGAGGARERNAAAASHQHHPSSSSQQLRQSPQHPSRQQPQQPPPATSSSIGYSSTTAAACSSMNKYEVLLDKVRTRQTLHIKVAEAKNLPTQTQSHSSALWGAMKSHRSDDSEARDTFCVVSLDQEEIFRTNTVEKNNFPVYCEEFKCQVPRSFRYLNYYVYDRGLKQSKPLGKVSLKREELNQYQNRDTWFALRPVDADSEVQGKVHIEIRTDEFAAVNSRSASSHHLASSSVVAGTTASSLAGTPSSTGDSGGSVSGVVYGSPTRGSVGSSSSGSSLAEGIARASSSSGGLGGHSTSSLGGRGAGGGGGGGGGENSGGSSSGGGGGNKLAVRVVECSDLNIIHGCCDPYMEISLWCNNNNATSGSNMTRIDTKKTKVKRKTQNPRYNESFVFDYLNKLQSKDGNLYRDFSGILDEDLDRLELRVTVWHYHISGDCFLGEVKIPLETLKGQPLVYNAWYFLQPRRPRALPSSSTSTSLTSTSGSSLPPPSSASLTSSPSSPATSSVSHSSSFLGRNAIASSPTSSNSLTGPSPLGSLRLRITYMEDHIFPKDYYENLGNLLYKSHHVYPIPCSAAFLLGELVEANNRSEAAQSIVRLFMNKGTVVQLLRALGEDEISNTQDPMVLFRGNTVATKCIDEFMKIAGGHYLHYTLKAIIDEIFSAHKPCEIDSTLLRREDNFEENYQNLKSYVVRIIKSITDSALVCPTLLCEVFYSLKDAAVKYFPEQQEAVKYVVVSGFIFLRFFAPAILGPRLFQLRQDTPDALTQRTLTLISKAIQGLGNLVCSPNSVSLRNRDKSYKEVYMQSLYKDLTESEHLLDAVRRFLDIISCAKRAHAQNIEAPIILKEGVMIKRAQGRRRWGRKNFKRRFFCLTTNGFFYAKEKGSDPLCQMPLEDILAVETLEEESFRMKYMFQVIQPKRTLYIQAANCVEEREWVDTLTKICRGNQGRLKHYHPSAYINGQYQCCKAPLQHAPGCEPVSVPEDDSLLHPIRLDVDEEAEMQRIHSFFLSKVSEMERLRDECEAHIFHENPTVPVALSVSLPTTGGGVVTSTPRASSVSGGAGAGSARPTPSPSPSPSSSKGTAVPSTATSATVFFPPSFSSSSYPPPSGTASSASSTPSSNHAPPSPPFCNVNHINNNIHSASVVPQSSSAGGLSVSLPPPPPRTPKTPKTPLSTHSSGSGGGAGGGGSGCSCNNNSHHGSSLSSPPLLHQHQIHHNASSSSTRPLPPPLTPVGAVGGQPPPPPRTPPNVASSFAATSNLTSPQMMMQSLSLTPSSTSPSSSSCAPSRLHHLHHKPPPPPPPLQVNFTPITDPILCLRTVEEILSCVKKLHQDHTQYLRALYKAMQYGSKQAPIGDDNYLRMAAQLRTPATAAAAAATTTTTSTSSDANSGQQAAVENHSSFSAFFVDN